MMSKTLLIVFVKSFQLGKVKTRLAKSIGDNKAVEVYKKLVDITETETKKTPTEKWIFFSETITPALWQESKKFIQKGADLGERMQNAFHQGFEKDFEKIVLIGSDLPDISAEIIELAFDELTNNEVVIGPAKDGGYYLLGLKQAHNFLFENKSWSQNTLLKETIADLKKANTDYTFLEELNDIDTLEDLEKSILWKNYL